METFSALLAICAGNSPVPGEFPAQRPVTRSFDVYFDLRPNKRLSKQSLGWWFETLSPPLWRHRNAVRSHAISQLVSKGWNRCSNFSNRSEHDDVINWKHFPSYWLFVGGIHRPPVNSPHKGQWRVALMYSLTCTWIEKSRGFWFETPSRSLWRHCDDLADRCQLPYLEAIWSFYT